MEPLRWGDPHNIGNYQLVARLGEGGMGSVYLGKSPSGLLVAVKVVRSDLAADESFRKRFLREIAAMRRVGGGYVAELLDCDQQAPRLWLATRFVVGTTLADLVLPHGKDRKPLPPQPMPVGGVWWLAFGLIKALAAIHASGIVHRDLKPSNIMLSPHGPRVIDFGIAAGLTGSGFGDPAITLPGMKLGTPQYMSPEQHLAWTVDTSSDVYSLGAVLVVVLTGIQPELDGFNRLHWEQGLRAVPGELQEVVRWCLESSPGDRPTLSQLLTPTVLGTERYQRVLPSWWPAPTAGQVDDAAAHVFDSLSPSEGRPMVTEHNGWEQWYIRGHRTEDKPQQPRRPIRPGLDGEFYAAYRPTSRGSLLERRPGEGPDAAEYAVQGDRHMERRRYADAVEAYQASLKLDSKDAVVWNDLGRALYGPGRMREAERAFASALAVNPGLLVALRNRYLVIYKMGGAGDTAHLEGEKLEDACNDVVGRCPVNAAEYSNLGDAYRTLDDHLLSASAYQAALDLDPDNPWLRRKLT
jgi:serine/threonine protein kinase